MPMAGTVENAEHAHLLSTRWLTPQKLAELVKSKGAQSPPLLARLAKQINFRAHLQEGKVFGDRRGASQAGDRRVPEGKSF